jgi:hypothetical protein
VETYKKICGDEDTGKTECADGMTENKKAVLGDGEMEMKVRYAVREMTNKKAT